MLGSKRYSYCVRALIRAVHIIITGEVGIGKTTVCEKIVAVAKRLGCSCGGFLTPKSNQGIVIIDIQTGESKPLASLTDIYKGPCIGRYFFNPEGINFGIKAIDAGVSSDILCVDEIGYLELKGEGFAKVLGIVTTGRVKNSILVIRKELLLEFLPRLEPRALIMETTIYNRSELSQKICTLLNLGKTM